MYCVRGREMLQDLKRSEWLPQFDEDGMRTVCKEMDDVFERLQSLLEGRDEQNLPDSRKVQLAYYYQCLRRNQKFLSAFVTYRIEKLRRLRWESGPVIPESINRDVLSTAERDYFSKYNSILADFNEEIGLDLTSDLEPPKDLLVEVRVLEDCGQVMTDSGPVNLSRGTISYLRRSQIESFLKEGKIEQVLQSSEC